MINKTIITSILLFWFFRILQQVMIMWMESQFLLVNQYQGEGLLNSFKLCQCGVYTH